MLLRGPHRIGDRSTTKTAGVRILSPAATTRAGARVVRAPPLDPQELGVGVPPSNVTGIQLVVDGEIVDLNRIRLPADTPIIDRRFAE